MEFTENRNKQLFSIKIFEPNGHTSEQTITTAVVFVDYAFIYQRRQEFRLKGH
jgi:hypothetical protein